MDEFEIDEFDMQEACFLYCQSPVANGLPCGQASVMYDACGMVWCEEHTYRGEFINWGKAHGWPALAHKPLYEVAAGEGAWMLVAGFGSEDMVLMLQVAIEEMEQAA